MTPQPHKPPEGIEQQGVRSRRERIKSLLAGLAESATEGLERGLDVLADIGDTPVTRRSALGAALAAGLVLAPMSSRPAHAEGGGGWPGAFVERYSIPEWGPEELERLANAYSLLSGYRTNPSFWRYVTNHRMEASVYEAIDAVLAHPELVHYKDEGDGVIRIIPRGNFPSLPAGLEIEITGGLKNGRITRIRINGADLEIDPHASLSWEDYREVLKGTADEYWKTLQLLYFIDKVMDSGWATPDKYYLFYPPPNDRKKRQSILTLFPREVQRDFIPVLEKAKQALQLSQVMALARLPNNTPLTDARKIQIAQAFKTQLPKTFQDELRGILAGGGTEAQKVQAIKLAAEKAMAEIIKDFIKSVDLSAGGKVLYETYDDFTGEALQMPDLIKALMALRRKQGYMDPPREDPAQNPEMDRFLSETAVIPYPVVDADGTVVMRFFVVELPTVGINPVVTKVIAFSPEGQVMDHDVDWANFSYPEGKTTRDRVHAKFKAQLGL